MKKATHISQTFHRSESETGNKFWGAVSQVRHSRRLRDCLIKRELNGNRKCTTPHTPTHNMGNIFHCLQHIVLWVTRVMRHHCQSLQHNGKQQQRQQDHYVYTKFACQKLRRFQENNKQIKQQQQQQQHVQIIQEVNYY